MIFGENTVTSRDIFKTGESLTKLMDKGLLNVREFQVGNINMYINYLYKYMILCE